MPSLPYEREALRTAEAHIEAAEHRIARMEEVTRLARESRPELLAALAALKDGLDAMHGHRQLILSIISDLEAGRLRDPPEDD